MYDSSSDRSGENLVVKRAQVGVIPGWVTEWEVLSATPLGSIEAHGNGGRRPVGVGLVGLPLCRNKSVRVGWADVGGAEAWASYQSIGTQSGQYLSSDPGWWGLTFPLLMGALFSERTVSPPRPPQTAPTRASGGILPSMDASEGRYLEST
ncbi:hypothetical protein ACLOJK_000660 [Asimina triloba]